MKRLILSLLCCIAILAPYPVWAQNPFADVFASALSSGLNKGFKGQALRGTRNGMGMLQSKKDIYIGDFANNKRHGSGMQILTKGVCLESCPNAYVFVGRWFEDKREGSGRCYDADGYLIYEGKFSEGKPTEDYPTPNDSLQMLNVMRLPNGDYMICETFGGVPEGYGAILFSDGDMWQSRFKDGAQSGVGLYLKADGSWQTMNCFEYGNSQVISSSAEYEAMDTERKAYSDAHLARALDAFSQALNIGTSLASGDYKNASSSPSYNTSSEFDGSNAMAGGGSGNYQAMYANWEKRAMRHYNSLTNLGYTVESGGKKVHGSSGQGASSNTYTQQKKALREAQREMQRIRQKAAKAGITITKSQYEDITVSY